MGLFPKAGRLLQDRCIQKPVHTGFPFCSLVSIATPQHSPVISCNHNGNTTLVMAHKKLHLPTKICIVCNLPFTWRKKWQKNWEEVKYCSERCRNKKAIGNYELSNNKKSLKKQ